MATLLEDLITQGVCTPEVAEAVTRQLAQQGGGRLTDALVISGWAEERAVLRVLAIRDRTRFVTVEKLRAAKIEPDVLDRVPVRFAEAHSALPLKVEPSTATLLVVAAEPADPTFRQELQIVAGLTNIVPLVALERAIQAAIRRFYYGDVTAFENLVREIVPPRVAPPRRDTAEASLSKFFAVPGKPKG